jgi:hypothetical protein
MAHRLEVIKEDVLMEELDEVDKVSEIAGERCTGNDRIAYESKGGGGSQREPESPV